MFIYNKNNSFTGFGGNIMFQVASLYGIAKMNSHDYLINHNPWLDNFDYNFNCFPLANAHVELTINEDQNWNVILDDFKVELDNKKVIELVGYFQSEKYFKHVEDDVRRMFTFKREIYESVYNKYPNVFKDYKLGGKQPVSVHVRRGDYLKYPDNHPVLPLAYYREAMEAFSGTDVTFVLFGDDPEFSKQLIDFVEPQQSYVLVTDNSAAFDMCFMSLCRSHIIANSTFSWWGSWLSKDPKLIFAPLKKKWFGPAYSHLSVNDLYTPTMIEIDF